jgi:hypothetical protein
VVNEEKTFRILIGNRSSKIFQAANYRGEGTLFHERGILPQVIVVAIFKSAKFGTNNRKSFEPTSVAEHLDLARFGQDKLYFGTIGPDFFFDIR